MLYNLKPFDMELRSIFDTALREYQHETRAYNRQNVPDEYTNPPLARFKAVIYLKNNKALWYYSYDITKNNGKSFIDEQKGLMKLCRLVHSKQGQFKTAIIYANIEPRAIPGAKYDYMIAKFRSDNTYIDRPLVGFLLKGENCMLDLHNIELKPKTL